MKTVIVVILAVLLAAILLPVPVMAYMDNEYITLENKRENSTISVERYQYNRNPSYYSRQGYEPYIDPRECGSGYDNGYYGNGNSTPYSLGGSTVTGSSEQRAEGFSIGANIKVGNSRFNLAYTKAKAKQNAKVESRPNYVQQNQNVASVGSVGNNRFNLFDENGSKICPIEINTNKSITYNTLIVFSRNGIVIAEYKVVRINGNNIAVQTFYLSQRPTAGDGFSLQQEKAEPEYRFQ